MSDKRRIRRMVCRRCGRYGQTEWHHVFGGPLRRISDKQDLVVELCHECHRELHEHPGIALVHKQRLQREWEKSHSRDEWMAMMHKNWLEE